jgi:hypothetical protein
MNCVTIKGHPTDGLVAVETYHTDTNAVGGFVVSALDLWHWLWERRPCRVHLRGRDYWLPLTARAVQPVPSVFWGV